MSASLADDRFRRGLEAYVGIAFHEGNSVRRLRNGIEIFPAMLEAIRLAERRIDFVTFVYWTGAIARQTADALAERARAGVEVRVLLDAVGAHAMSARLVSQLVDAGVEMAWFRPVVRWKVWEADHRTHRKILAIDDKVAFTGGVGIAAEWEGDARHPDEWRDSHFEIRGPAVDPLRSAFLADWRDTGHRMFSDAEIPPRPELAGGVTAGVVDSSAQIELNSAGRAIETLVRLARDRLWITTPYFNPSPELTEVVVDAARRGVEVRLMIPGPHIDKRVSRIAAEEQAGELLEAGVWLHRYQPTMLHLKQMVIDSTAVMFGSVNINARSFYKDEEVAVVAIDPALNDLLASDFLDDLARCDTLTEPSDLSRPVWEQVTGKVLKPIRSEL